MTSLKRSPILIFLIVLGLLWASLDLVTFLALGGADELTVAYLSKSLLLYSWMLVGPLLLIVGVILSFGSRQILGSILSMAGCVILTIMVGYLSISMFKSLADPLIARPPYGQWAVGVILTLLADVGAVQLYRTSAKANRTPV